MNRQEKLQFIVDNSNYLTDKDWTMVVHIFRIISNFKKAREEENEVLSDKHYAISDNFRDIYELDTLSDRLFYFQKSKGISNTSTFSFEDMLALINFELRTLKDNASFLKDTIQEIKEILSDKTKEEEN